MSIKPEFYQDQFINTPEREAAELLTQVLVDEGSRRQCVDGKETEALVLGLHDVQSSIRSTLEPGYDRAGQRKGGQRRAGMNKIGL